jgi:hypothetical protein
MMDDHTMEDDMERRSTLVAVCMLTACAVGAIS